MKLKEILDDARAHSKGNPVGYLSYCLEMKDKIEVGKMVTVSFRNEDEEQTLNRMREIVQEPGFMFFMNSEEGRKFIEDNKKVISEYMLSLVRQL